MLVAVGLTAWSLFQPLVRFPVVGSLSFSLSSLGGAPTAYGIIAALVVATLILLVPGQPARFGLLLGGLSIGYLGATLFAIYRTMMEKALDLADSSDSGIRTLLAQREYQPATWLLALGLLLWSVCALSARLHTSESP
jgi:hypothetical protein